jgi:hypothetical protein
MRFVPVKDVDQQAVLMMHRARNLLVRQRTMAVNALRAHLAEFGVVAPQGLRLVECLVAAIEENKAGLPELARSILKPLVTIQCRNAIINDDATAAVWPDANVVVGNPPYLGAKLMKGRLGVEMTDAIRSLYVGRLPGFTDLVCYWFENARAMIEAGKVERAGLVATNSIRKNTNLPVMHRISATTRIFEAWSEQQWTVDGAAVDVSLICFGDAGVEPARLDGQVVTGINPDLTTGLDLTIAHPLRENRDGAFLGIQKSGPFDVPGEVARAWMKEP